MISSSSSNMADCCLSMYCVFSSSETGPFVCFLRWNHEVLKKSAQSRVKSRHLTQYPNFKKALSSWVRACISKTSSESVWAFHRQVRKMSCAVGRKWSRKESQTSKCPPRLEHWYVPFVSDVLRNLWNSPAITSFVEHALTLFGVVTWNRCVHCVEDLYHPELISFVNKGVPAAEYFMGYHHRSCQHPPGIKAGDKTRSLKFLDIYDKILTRQERSLFGVGNKTDEGDLEHLAWDVSDMIVSRLVSSFKSASAEVPRTLKPSSKKNGNMAPLDHRRSFWW